MSIKYLIKTLGLALVAALAVAAVAASAAFAHGAWKATKFPVTVKGTGGAAHFESEEVLGVKRKIECEKSSSTGSIESEVKAKTTVTYSGKCELTENTTKTACTEPIITKELTIQPGDISGTGSSGLGDRFTGEGAESIFAVVTCGTHKITVKGHLVCETESGAKSTTGKIICVGTGPGKQKFTSITKVGAGEESFTGQELTANEGFLGLKDAQTTNETLTYTNSGGGAEEVEQVA